MKRPAVKAEHHTLMTGRSQATTVFPLQPGSFWVRLMLTSWWFCFHRRKRTEGCLMFGCIYRVIALGSVSFLMSDVWAQRPLVSPDLSTFTNGGITKLSADATGPWMYVSGFRSRAMGLTRRGVVRVTTDGAIDGAWQTTGISYVFSHIKASNGDVYVYGWETTNGPSVIGRYSSTQGGPPLAVYRGDGVVNNFNSGIGAMFGGRGRWIYFTDSNSGKSRLNRIDTTTGLVDPAWSYLAPYTVSAVAEGGDDTLFVVEDANTEDIRGLYVRRIDARVSSTELWRRAYAPGYVTITADSRGRLYVMAQNRDQGTVVTVRRLNAIGLDDPLWDGTAVSAAASVGQVSTSITAVGDTLAVSMNVYQAATQSVRSYVVRFDQNGAEAARWEHTRAESISSVTEQPDGRVYVAIDDTLQVLDVATLKPIRSQLLNFGRMGTINSITALPDGGRLFLGRFTVWYNGLRFQNILRTRPDGTPDTAWRVELDGFRSVAKITSRDIVLVGDFTRINGVSRPGAALISLSAGAAVSNLVLPASQASTIDNQNNLYFVNVTLDGRTIRRLSLTTGQIDSNWSIVLESMPDKYPSQLEWDQGGGLWLFWEGDDDSFVPSDIKQSLVQRFNVADRQQTLNITAKVPKTFPRTFFSTDEHVYLDRRRYRISEGGQLDTTWQPDRSPRNSIRLQALSRDYLYHAAYTGDLASIELKRIALNGAGEADPTWRALPQQLKKCDGDAQVALFVSSNRVVMEDFEILVECSDDLPQGLFDNPAGSMTLFSSRNDVVSDVSIVEFFNRSVNRYFITSRASEQALLDAQPATFVRTGMRFVAKSSRYSDTAETPVCRLYAPPAAGGSNTHFYGVGDDCPALNTVRQLSFEGFDFAAIKPVDGACPSGARKPVYRLFNNQAATNNGNHRYVVSDATRTKMQASGWVDEGAVFCAASVTDAAPL
jgi:hypothetical protein